MKKILTFLCAAVVLVSISSCTKQYVAPNDTQTVYATLAPTDWTLFSDGKSYQAPISVPDIGANFAASGAVIVAVSYSDGVYEQIPEVYNGTSFSFTYNQGNVTLYAQSADGGTPIAPTQTIKVKITLVSTQ